MTALTSSLRKAALLLFALNILACFYRASSFVFIKQRFPPGVLHPGCPTEKRVSPRCSVRFAPPPPFARITQLHAKDEEDDDEEEVDTRLEESKPRRKRVRKRKGAKTTSGGVEESSATAPAGSSVSNAAAKTTATTTTTKAAAPVSIELKPREKTVFSLQVQDVRDIVAGKTTSVPNKRQSVSKGRIEDDEEEYEDDDDDKDENGTGLDSLERLLADARQMQAMDDAALAKNPNEQGFSLPTTVGGALSAIVTADFFLVCIFLVWFLAGVFGSYVLNNDTVQIAFNKAFQPFVQPALGVLMIGSIASAIFKEEEGEEQR